VSRPKCGLLGIVGNRHVDLRNLQVSYIDVVGSALGLEVALGFDEKLYLGGGFAFDDDVDREEGFDSDVQTVGD
jgi:hypothetical protein